MRVSNWLVVVVLAGCVACAVLRGASGPSVTAEATAEKSNLYNADLQMAAPNPNFVPPTREEVAMAHNKAQKEATKTDQVLGAIISGKFKIISLEPKLISGTMPLTTTTPGPNTRSAVYDFGQVHVVAWSAKAYCNAGNPGLALALFASVDKNNWTEVLAKGRPCTPHSHTITGRFPATRYAKWVVYANDSSGSQICTVALSNPLFYSR